MGNNVNKDDQDNKEVKSDATKEKSEKDTSSNENSINTCAGGLTESEMKKLQEELDAAKEENSFSTSSRCTIA
ncbi:CLUMA_CG000567, isoform A [Clunio marinus]|uniref:CLUMA_CG000567, isoform A n=1 Tax=Clunio marinus TaxID=568069 RepID=A0A1J1HJT8_9DIPT|nr:CLUMA_CG000567, isoform A [Clunio marinus]